MLVVNKLPFRTHYGCAGECPVRPEMYLRAISACMVVLLLPVAAAQEQSLVTQPEEQEHPRSLPSLQYPHHGLQLYSVSAAGSWFSGGGSGVSGFGGFGSTFAGANSAFMGNASMGWSRSGRRSLFGVTYSPSYVSYPQRPELGVVSHSFALSASTSLSSRWSLGMNVTAQYSTADQLLFSPGLYRTAVTIPATFDELANAVLSNASAQNQLAGLLTGSPVADVPGRELLFGTKMFVAASNVSLAYTATPRTTLTFSGNINRFQPVSNDSNGLRSAALLGTVTNASGSVSVTHSLTPRTQIGVNTSLSNQISGAQSFYSTTTSAFAGRKMGVHWFAQLQGGAGWIRSRQTTYNLPSSAQYQAGGSLGYKTYAHTFLFTAARSLADQYGLGAGATVSTSGAWHYSHPRHPWGLTATVAHQSFLQRTAGDLSTLQFSSGFTRRLPSHLFLSTDYVYVFSSGGDSVTARQPDQHAVRASVTWSPSSGVR